MNRHPDLNARERRRRERKVWRLGIVVSVLLHAALFLGWRGSVLPTSPYAAAGPRSGDFRAAAGSMQALNLQTPPARPIVPPPVPIAVDVTITPVDFEDEIELDPSAMLGEAPGMLDRPGLETGVGEGDGGDSEEGLYRLQPASPRGMIIPPTQRDLRGTEVQVWVFVDERGRVVADSTRLDPPTRDARFNRRLLEEAAEWVFRPAVQDGRPVASWFPYTIAME